MGAALVADRGVLLAVDGVAAQATLASGPWLSRHSSAGPVHPM